MALFEQLGQKLAGAGQSAVQQAKNVTDVAKLNNEISSKERTIAKLYTEIGRTYYDRHKDDPAAEELQTVSEISALYGEIMRCRETIKGIKGIVKCPVCGAEVSAESLFCSACGEKMPPPAMLAQDDMQETKICPNCHASVSGENKYCIYCGTKMD